MFTIEENDILQEIIVTQEGKGEIVDFPKGTLSLSHGTSSLEGTRKYHCSPENTRISHQCCQRNITENHGRSPGKLYFQRNSRGSQRNPQSDHCLWWNRKGNHCFLHSNSVGDYWDYSGNQDSQGICGGDHGYPHGNHCLPGNIAWIHGYHGLCSWWIITGNHGVPPGNCYSPRNTRILSLSFTESDKMWRKQCCSQLRLPVFLEVSFRSGSNHWCFSSTSTQTIVWFIM